MVTGCPLGPDSELTISTVYAGIPKLPGAVLCANSNTSLSKPGWWATRIATNCAWLLGFPPVARGHAAAGDDPGLGATLGAVVGATLGRAVALAEGAVVGVSDREADADGVGVADGRASG
jgi:hypothetical protein